MLSLYINLCIQYKIYDFKYIKNHYYYLYAKQILLTEKILNANNNIIHF